MSIETLLNAAEYLEYENQTTTKPKLSSPSQSVITDSGTNSTGSEPKKIVSSIAKEPIPEANTSSTNVKQVVNPLSSEMLESKDRNKEVNILKTTVHAGTFCNSNPATLSNHSNKHAKELLQEPTAVSQPAPAGSQRTLITRGGYIGAVSKSANMNPLFARARAAVESVKFSEENECTLRTPVEIETSNASLVITRPVQMTLNNNQAPHVLANPNPKPGVLSVPLNPPWALDPRAPRHEILSVQNTPVGIQQMDLNKLLPSLAKISEEDKGPSTLQLKQVKRGATLTHNQLEKNRRAHLKECFEALKTSIPRLGMRRSSNLTILKAALRHIQIMKRKSGELQQTLSQLKKDKEEKEKRVTALVESLSKMSSRETIEKYLEEEVRKEIAQSRANPLQDDGQLSTSTASEAEEEEWRVTLNASNEDSDKQSYKNHHTAHYRFLDTASQQSELTLKTPEKVLSQMQQRKDAHAPAQPNQFNVIAQPKYQFLHQPHPEANRASEISKSQSLRVVIPPTEGSFAEKTSSSFHNLKRSPIKLFGQPSGRSATPSPPSNIVHLFSMGSRGSPPLLTSSSDDLPVLSAKNHPQKQESATLKPSGTSDKHLRPVPDKLPTLASQSPHRSLSPAVATTTSIVPSSVLAASNSAVNPTSFLPLSNGERTPRGNILLPQPLVPMPSYSGYEVKVKYLNSTSPLTSVTSSTIDQTHIPMKKRHLDANTFASVQPSSSIQVSSSSRSKSSTRPDSELQMTSLYVGASAALLSQGLSSGGLGSTSDNESDRDSSQFRDPKRAKVHHHWRKNLVNDRSGWVESRSKPPEKNIKKKPLQLHQYEAPQPKVNPSSSSKPSGDTKPKAMFNLWDRKHHAITMTTATNWRGKPQQHLLAVTKAKFTSVSASAPDSKFLHQPSTCNSVTQVSFSALRSKPTVPASLVVGKAQEKSPRVVAAEPQKVNPSGAVASVSPAMVKSVHGQTAAVVNGPAANPAMEAIPVHLPGNQIAYRMVQSSVPSTPVATSFLATSTPHNPILAAPMMNYMTFNGVGGGATNSRELRSLATVASSTPQALVAPSTQTNPMQMPLMMPTVIPVGYVMLPGGNQGNIVHNGLQIAGLPPHAKVIAPGDLMPMQPIPQGPVKIGTKRSASPVVLPGKPPTRNRSTDSSSSSTLSADSVDPDHDKGGRSAPKKIRLSNLPTQQPQSDVPPPVAPPRHVAQLPQQFVVPGNSGFFMAAPTSGSNYTMPLQLLSYPFQGHPGEGYIQAVQMPGMLAPRAVNQMWPVGQTVLPQCETPVAMPTSSSTNQRVNASPVTPQRAHDVSQ